MADKFWMLLVDGTHSTSRKHPTMESARQEAERLLNIPGYHLGVTILEAVEYGKLNINPILWAKIDHIVAYQGEEIKGNKLNMSSMGWCRDREGSRKNEV